MPKWLQGLQKTLRQTAHRVWKVGHAGPFSRRHHRRVKKCRDNSATSPPPLNWIACHPSTRHVFKATMACPYGHVLTLRIHTIAKDGTVSPSVICSAPGCSFHEYVRLIGWTFGEVS